MKNKFKELKLRLTTETSKRNRWLIACPAAKMSGIPADTAGPESGTAPQISGSVLNTNVAPNQLTIVGSRFGTASPVVTLGRLPVTLLSYTDTVSGGRKVRRKKTKNLARCCLSALLALW